MRQKGYTFHPAHSLYWSEQARGIPFPVGFSYLHTEICAICSWRILNFPRRSFSVLTMAPQMIHRYSDQHLHRNGLLWSIIVFQQSQRVLATVAHLCYFCLFPCPRETRCGAISEAMVVGDDCELLLWLRQRKCHYPGLYKVVY